MKKYTVVILLFMILTGCNDGDIIVTNFNFDSDSPLHHCQTASTEVLYIVNTDPDESIAFSFNQPDFDGTLPQDTVSQTLNIPLSTSHPLVYRSYDGALQGSSYFCSGIPPTEPKITDEYTAVSGTITVTTTLTDQTLNPLDSSLTRSFLTRAVGHDLTLKESSGKDVIVEETLNLGSFTKTATIEL